MSTKTVFLIADGMGDWPLEELDGQTPMEAAATPHMDGLAAQGLMGTIQTVPQGMPPGSDVANMALLGFDPAELHTGRGPIEAAAQGLSLDPRDLVYRLNLVAISGVRDGVIAPSGNMLDYSSGHIATEDSTPLIEMLQRELGDDTFTFVPGIQYRHLLVQKGGADSLEAELEPNPPHDRTDKPLAPDLETYARSQVLNSLLHRAASLLASPSNTTRANSIWPWGQGRPLILPDFEKTFGLKGAVVTAVDLVKGLGRASNMAVPEVPGVTGLLDTNYQGKVDAALSFLEQGDFVYLHVEAPDECGHSGIASDKVEAIRRFDERIVGPMIKGLAGTDTLFVLACDHLTPIAIRTHATDPVPFVAARSGAVLSGQGADAGPYNERNAAATGLSIGQGHAFLSYTLDLIK